MEKLSTSSTVQKLIGLPKQIDIPLYIKLEHQHKLGKLDMEQCLNKFGISLSTGSNFSKIFFCLVQNYDWSIMPIIFHMQIHYLQGDKQYAEFIENYNSSFDISKTMSYDDFVTIQAYKVGMTKAKFVSKYSSKLECLNKLNESSFFRPEPTNNLSAKPFYDTHLHLRMSKLDMNLSGKDLTAAHSAIENDILQARAEVIKDLAEQELLSNSYSYAF